MTDTIVRVDHEVAGIRVADAVKLSELPNHVAAIQREGGTVVGVSLLERPTVLADVIATVTERVNETTAHF